MERGGGRGLAPTHNIMFKPYINICHVTYIFARENVVYIYIMWACGLEPTTHNMYGRDLLYVLYIVLARGYTRCTVLQLL
jgi:hypothetical protein